ncbi:RHS repeat-associated core domain-containing protein [Streptomyces sp. NBC_01262]|uniref:RHS repeat-associated core domain-containing protein n=1 Tax=Streptomyces sp. NBC_01262 TaxID=2903803 RepID=UPI002E322B30|nr:RHS repeat-associated core domain-containing protein [Streptomyces sp. NBC_01262]
MFRRTSWFRWTGRTSASTDDRRRTPRGVRRGQVRRPAARYRWPKLGPPGVVLLATALIAGTVSPAVAAVRRTPQAATSTASPVSSSRADAAGPAADVMVNGWGDGSGYHVDVATGRGGYAWRELTVLRPAGIDDSAWTGYQCVSGDGKYAAVAILPASSVNLAVARDHGAFAYSVNLRTGAAKPVAAGVALKYHSPGCGIGDVAEFTVNPGDNQRTTQVLSADLQSGKVKASTTVEGQVTSVVPTPDGPVGVMGSTLVRIPEKGTAAGRPVRLATVSGLAYDLRPAAGGGVDFAVQRAAGKSSLIMRERSGKLSTLGEGAHASLQLMQGRAGRALAVGATRVASGSGIRKISTQALPYGATSVSLDGGAVTGAGQKTAQSAPVILATRSGKLIKSHAPTSSGRSSTALPSPAPAAGSATASQSAQRPALSSTADSSSVRSATLHTTVATSAAAAASSTTPKCSVGRNEENRQVMQPGTAQVSWAVQMAEQGLLSGSSYQRAANYANLGLVAYAPNDDFSKVALEHPSSDTWDSVPRSVYEAIVAQESNYSQASWHALPGIPGNPLIADYYGAGGLITTMDYSKADCGYGLGQVTSGMATGDTTYSVHGQWKIAVDYQENVAAGLQILERTWNQLYDAGITVNGGDPKYLENWYFAAWAYNSGIQPTAAFGNTTGCTPSATCTGPDGTWGLGWANNPRNPDYPPTRAPYLRDSYADASHPASWPYQERIMGWMGQPILRFNEAAYSTPDYHGGKTWLQIPPVDAFCTSDNLCDPTGTQSSDYCSLTDYECWWHQPVTFISDCSTTCATSSYTASAGSSEPTIVKPHPHPPSCSLDTTHVHDEGSGSPIIVDESQSQPPLNLVGCGSSNWSQDGTFSYSYGTNSAGDPIGALDTHQLGVGFGGHVLFTHTEDGSNPAEINTGTWTPNLPKLQYYKIKLHFPSTAASATNVVYTINPGGGASPWKIRVNQDWGTEEWVTIGTFAMENGATVKLTNKSDITGSGNINYADYDIAYDAVAFIPEGGTPGHPIGGPPGVKDAPKGSNPAWVQCGCVRRTAGDPVDTSTGAFGDTFTDLSTPGRGMPLNFTRTYASALASPDGPNATLAEDGPFGWGWTYSYNLSSTTDSTSGDVTIKQEDGSQVTFTDVSGNYTPSAPRYDATLTQDGSNYVFTRKSKEIFTFDTATGHLVSETDLVGSKASPAYATTLAYDSSGNLHTITDPGGRVYTLTWTGSHITALTDSASRKVTYAYDSDDNLTDVYGVGTTRSPSLQDDDHTQYTYTTAHLMSSMRSPNNFGSTATPTPVTAMTYDSSERVLTQTNPVGGTTTFTYGPDTSADLTDGQTLVTDPSGHKTLDTYADGLLTSETKGYGTSDAGTWTYTYDPISLGVTSISDPDGNLQTFAYDDHGNQISASDARGFTTTHAYDDSDNLTTTITPDGLRTDYAYDETGHIAAGGDGYGLLTSTTQEPADGSATARTTSVYYDDTAHPGDATRTVDARGNTSRATYDTAGDAISTTDPAGDKTQFGYDTTRGVLTSMVSPVGTAAGTVPGCTPPATGCTTYTYDAWDNRTGTTDPLGHTTSAVSDADGNQTSATDGNGQKTTYSYDAADRQTTATRPDTTVVKTAYNDDGTVAKTTDGAGAATSYAYDAQGRQTGRTDAKNRTTTSAYDTAGLLTTLTDPDGRVTTYAYDPAGNAASVSYSDGTTPNITGIGYDAMGRRTGMTDGTGTSSWSYDAFGELTAQTNGSGSTVGYAYDANSNETSVTYPGTGAGTVTRTFDAANRLTSVKDWTSQSTTFGYTGDGQWKSTTYPNSTVATTSFDAANQPTADTLTSGSTTLASLAYTRDSAGQLASDTGQTYQYTALEQLKSSTTGTTTTSFAYDAADNPVQVGTSGQTFDAANQLCWSTTATMPTSPTCASAPTGATTYTYNSEGDRTNAATTSAATTYSYNQADQLTGVTSDSTTATYTYDGDGLRASKTVGATTTAFTWDGSAAPDLLSDGSTAYLYGPNDLPVEQITGSTPLYYFHDQLGSTRGLTNSAGAITGAYTYTPYGAATSHTGTASTPLQYTGQYTDAETGFVYLRARYYDPATAQFLTVDPEVESTLEAYVYVVGNPLNLTDPTGLFGWGSIGHAFTDHWRGIAQVAIVATATVAAGLCTAATAGVCAGAGGIIISAGIGFAAGVGSYEVGGGQHTWKGALQQGAIGAGSYGAAAGVGKGAMLMSRTSKYLTFTDTLYNAARNGGRFWKQGENVREVINHCGFGTRWP